MGLFHIDPECNRLFQALADALGSFERQTGRQSALAFLPLSPDEKIVLLVNGKIRDQKDYEDSLAVVLNWAKGTRKNLSEGK
jgi:hypothetical protein